MGIYFIGLCRIMATYVANYISVSSRTGCKGFPISSGDRNAPLSAIEQAGGR
jgi:hypothetical protein